jgi:hypothetical protein
MEDMQGDPSGPQFYLLSSDGYESLKHLQDMLTLMAHITYNEEHVESGNAMMSIGRAELCFIFQSIHWQIEGALERVGEENWVDGGDVRWQ